MEPYRINIPIATDAWVEVPTVDSLFKRTSTDYDFVDIIVLTSI